MLTVMSTCNLNLKALQNQAMLVKIVPEPASPLPAEASLALGEDACMLEVVWCPPLG